jgi:Ca2+-binding RTX toxin-like protein
MAWLIGNDLKNDWLIGGAAADTIKGLGGNDTLKGGGGADWIDGGAGIDTAMYVDSPSAVVVNLATERGYGGTAEGDRLVSIETVYGSSYADSLFGNEAANELRGLDNSDYLDGRGGMDLLEGGYGSDTLIGGAGADHLDGGPGDDTVKYTDSPAGVIVSLALGTGHGGDAQGDTLVGIERIYGSAHDDTLTGDDVFNVLDGGAGDDVLIARGGNDLVYGGGGRDRMHGGDGSDSMFGGADDDLIWGGMQRDDMTGGPGADTFMFEATEETGTTTVTADTIYDFNFAEGDRIGLGGIDADVYAAGNQAFRFIGTAAFSGTPGELRYFHADGYTYVEMQTGTSVDVEGIVRLTGIHTPEASWFVL